MFNLSQRKYIFRPKVKDLIAILEGENPEAALTVDGLDEFYIHVAEDTGAIGIDLSDLESDYAYYYEQNNLEYPEEISNNTLKQFKIDYGFSRIECLQLLEKIVDNISQDELLKYGFTEEQIKFIKGES
jgi:hypothetical protein